MKVSKHKTMHEGRAKLVLTEAFNNRMDSYLNTIRPRLMAGAQERPHFFVLPGGKPIDQLHGRMAPLAKRFQVGHFSANQVRQAAATQAADTLPAGKRELVARQLSHSLDIEFCVVLFLYTDCSCVLC